MTREADRPLVVVRGTMRSIEYAVCANRSMPAKEFIEGLDEGDQRKLDVLFRKMAETGKLFNKEQFKLVKEKIYEFKRHQIRIGCFQVETSWVLTHGFKKKTDRWPQNELKRAERIREEDLARRRAKRAGRQG